MKYFDEFGNEVTDEVNSLREQLAKAKGHIACIEEELAKKRQTPKKPKPTE